jgi:hydroxypyruvate isomerase
MTRRDFLNRTACASLASAVVPTAPLHAELPAPRSDRSGKFKLHYAPHPRMFKHNAGDDIVDQIKFAADQGFTAWEDNDMRQRTPEQQVRIGKTLTDLNMKMGVFVAHGSIGRLTFARQDPVVWDKVLEDLRDSVTVAKRVGAKWMTVVPGNMDEDARRRLAPGYQEANVIELLRRGAEIFEPHDLVMVLEPLNWFANHGGVFLRHTDQAYAICTAVNSPACKILFDIYHQQVSEGNLIPNIDRAWDQIAYFQAGDNPGRKEPGTGEINFRNVFKTISERSHAANEEFIIGMEHGNSKPGKEGELAVIQAYRDADGF